MPCKAEPALVFVIECGEQICDLITKDARLSCALPGEQRMAAGGASAAAVGTHTSSKTLAAQPGGYNPWLSALGFLVRSNRKLVITLGSQLSVVFGILVRSNRKLAQF
jgi:hypothetical protein